MCLCGRSVTKFVRGESIDGLVVCRKSGKDETFKEFG